MLLHIVVLNPNLRMNLSDELPGTDMITLTCLHGNTYRQASCCPSPSGCAHLLPGRHQTQGQALWSLCFRAGKPHDLGSTNSSTGVKP